MELCVFGAASSLIDQKYKEAGRKLGKALAQAGHNLVFGGGSAGMMGAVARGFHDVGNGNVTGVIPEFFEDGDYEELYDACDKAIYTDDISERISVMVEMSDAFIVTPGGIGTYEEFFRLFVSISLDRISKPLIVFDVDEFFAPLFAMLKAGVEADFIAADRLDMFKVFDSDQIPELIAYIEKLEKVL